MNLTDLIIPLIIVLIVFWGLFKKLDVFSEFVEGGKEGAKVAFNILPTLVALMTCIGMFKASGALEMISRLLAPITSLIGFPSECVPLALIRPVSGSGALAVYESLLTDNQPDSFIGRVASTLMGSTETTFYTLAVYFAAAKTKITNIRYALPAALSSDLTGFIISALLIQIFFGK